MKGFLGFLMIFVMAVLFAPRLFAMSQADAYKAEFQFNRIPGGQPSQLGTKIMRDNLHELVVQYDFAKDGGATGAGGFNLRVPASKGGLGAPKGTLPKGAIVTGCFVDVITAGTTSASGTMAISTGQGAGDLVTTTAAASYTGIVACTPVGTAATAIKLTADQTPKAVIATGALTAGKWNVHILYLLSDY